MAAFLPRALAKPQKILLPSIQKHKAGTLLGRRGADVEEIQVRDESGSISRLPIACQVDALDGNLEENDHGGISTMDAERAGSHQKAEVSGRKVSGAMVWEAMDYEALGDKDERPEALRIEKRPAEFQERPTGYKRRRGGGIPSKVGSLVDSSHVSVDAQPMEIGRKEEVHGSVTNCEVRSTLDLVDGEGGHAKGAAPSGPRKQSAGRPKKVFPYGNYDRYYGYRFGKTLSEDPRLSVFRKEWFEGKACLDVGCNEGYVTIAVAQKFEVASMVGVDIDGSLVAKAKSHLKREAAALRQANTMQRPRLDLADNWGVKQTLLRGPQSSKSHKAQLGKEESAKPNPVVQKRGDGGTKADILESGQFPSSDPQAEQLSRQEDRTTDPMAGASSGGGGFSARVSKSGQGDVPEAVEVNVVRTVHAHVSIADAEVSVEGPERAVDVGVCGLQSDLLESAEKENGCSKLTREELQVIGSREQLGLEISGLGKATLEFQDGGSGPGLKAERLEQGRLSENDLRVIESETLEANVKAGLVKESRLEVRAADSEADGGPSGLKSERSSALGGPLQGKRFPDNIEFRKENFVTSPLEEEKYDVVTSLSVVKWIHLNWGDDGLLRFFTKVYKTLKPGGLFILEPQPWKSYRNNRGVSEAAQRHFKEIKILPEQFPDVLKSKIGFRTADIISPAVPGSVGGFGRAIHLYRK